jgi:hypothetical protein
VLAALALACPAGRTTGGEAARPVPAGVAVPAPPATLAVAWTATDQAAAIDQRADPFALFPDDQSEADLASCRESRIREGSSDPERARCAYRPTGVLGVGGSGWWLGVYTEHSEWDGMTSRTEDVILVVPGDGTAVRHTVRQYHESIVDCGTTILQRRQAVRDLDGDGRVELCLEEVRETGPGLFELFDLADRGEPWVPFFRRRTFTAWTADDASGRLLRAATLDDACPDQGYAFLVAPTSREVGGPLAGRRELQGEQPSAPCTAELAEAAGCGDGYCDDPDAPDDDALE